MTYYDETRPKLRNMRNRENNYKYVPKTNQRLVCGMRE